MAKISKEEKIRIIGNMTPPVALTGNETVAALDKIIRERNGVDAAETAEDSDVEVPKKKATKGVHFVLASGQKRSFTPADHGEDFVAIANEFHETQKKYVQTRQDE